MVLATTNSPVSISRSRWWLRAGAMIFVLAALTVVYFTNQLLTERFTEATRNRADVRISLYVGSLVSELQRNSIVPQLLGRDPELIQALQSGDYTQSSARLLSFVDEIGAASGRRSELIAEIDEELDHLE